MTREDLWIVPLDGSFAVRSDREGIAAEGFDCRAAAQDFIDERRALEDEMQAADEAEAEQVALTVEAAQIELPGHVIDFLRALDRGDFGTAHRFGDGTESAYVAALRTAVAPFERRA